MNPTYRVCWTLSRAAFHTVFRCRVHNPERVPLHGPAILAANHESFLDPLLIGQGVTRDLHYLARESLFSVFGLGALLVRINVVPVDRDGGGGAGLKAILNRLLAGAAIVLFPEGTRTPDGRLRPARSGIGLTVLKSSALVVPVRVFGTYAAWGRHRRWPRPHPVAVKYGQPLRFAAQRAEAATCSKARLKELYQEVADEIMKAIGDLGPYTDKPHFP